MAIFCVSLSIVFGLAAGAFGDAGYTGMAISCGTIGFFVFMIAAELRINGGGE